MNNSKASKRSSSICQECRLRKVRCDGRRDLCSNCERLGLACSFKGGESVDHTSDPVLERRRVRLACAHCHSLKARCSGTLPRCQRCRSKNIDCVYASSKRVTASASVRSLSDRASTATPDRVSTSQQNSTPNRSFQTSNHGRSSSYIDQNQTTPGPAT